jgi:hypothetical protein
LAHLPPDKSADGDAATTSVDGQATPSDSAGALAEEAEATERE